MKIAFNEDVGCVELRISPTEAEAVRRACPVGTWLKWQKASGFTYTPENCPKSLHNMLALIGDKELVLIEENDEP